MAKRANKNNPDEQVNEQVQVEEAPQEGGAGGGGVEEAAVEEAPAPEAQA